MDKKLKTQATIVQVTKYFYPHMGGMESRILDLSRSLAKKGFRVKVLSSREENAARVEVMDGIEIHRSRSMFSLFNAPFIPGILVNLLRKEYDLIHIHLPDPFNSIFVLIANHIKKKPFIVTYHADILKNRWYHIPFRIPYEFILNRVLKRASRIMATSPNYVESSPILKKFKSKISIVPSFVDPKRFSPKVSGSVVRRRYFLMDRKVILFIGRLVSYKGIEYLIQGFQMLRERLPDTSLIIIGEGRLEKKLKKLAIKLNVESDVIFTGEVSAEELPEFYSACDLFALPSVTRQEAFGLTLVEAMATEKPVISSDFSGMPYVIGDTGILVEPRNPENLEEVMYKILTDEKLSKKLGEKGRKRVLENFTLVKMVEKIIKIYSRVLTT